MNDEMIRLMDEYLDMFEKTFPSYQLRHLGEERICEIIRDCIDRGEDVYEAEYLPPNNEWVEY